MYNVMIVEDDPMARRLLEIMVTSDESYHLAVSVESASFAEVYCMTEAIDLILMDVCTALHAEYSAGSEPLYPLERATL